MQIFRPFSFACFVLFLSFHGVSSGACGPTKDCPKPVDEQGVAITTSFDACASKQAPPSADGCDWCTHLCAWEDQAFMHDNGTLNEDWVREVNEYKYPPEIGVKMSDGIVSCYEKHNVDLKEDGLKDKGCAKTKDLFECVKTAMDGACK